MNKTATTYQRTDAAGLRRQLDSPTPGVVVDVRTPGEYAGRHIAGTLNLPLDVVRSRSGEIVRDLKAPVTVLCASGPRSEEAARVLQASGAAEVTVLDGGISAWEAAGGHVDQGQGTWAMERQVRLVAGSIVLSTVLASIRLPRAKWAAAGIGAGLTFSAVSNTCGMARMLSLLPYNRRSDGFDANAAIASLSDR